MPDISANMKSRALRRQCFILPDFKNGAGEWIRIIDRRFTNLFDPVTSPDFTCGGGLGDKPAKMDSEPKVLRNDGVLCMVR